MDGWGCPKTFTESVKTPVHLNVCYSKEPTFGFRLMKKGQMMAKLVVGALMRPGHCDHKVRGTFNWQKVDTR